MGKRSNNAHVVFSTLHIAQALQKVATVPGNYQRPYIYKTPSGTFCTLDQVAAVYGITKEGARRRFNNPNYQPWIADCA